MSGPDDPVAPEGQDLALTARRRRGRRRGGIADRGAEASAAASAGRSGRRRIGWAVDPSEAAAAGKRPRLRIGKGRNGGPPVSEDELMALTSAAAEAEEIEEAERDMIASALALDRTVVRAVMVPRTDMVTVDADTTVTAALEEAIGHGLSRLPVCRSDIDDIVGVVLLKDLARAERSGGGGRPVRDAMRRAMFVPETKRVDELLGEMRTAGGHLAVVVDEYGGTAGLVTLEDLVEELVGDIVDEFDRPEPLLEPLAGGEALVHGRMPVDQLNALVEAELPDDDWDTVGGLIFSMLGRVPEVGETVDVDGLRLRVEHMEGRRITRVRLTRA